MENKLKLLLSISGVAFALNATAAQASEIDTNIARMQAMDKITGMVRVIDVPVNSEVKYGSFSIVVRACKTRPPEETPENFAFVDVVDNYKSENPVNIFRGWMISSSPSLNPVEHPIYDIWLLNCENGKVDPRLKIMTAEELKVREQIPQAKNLDKNEPADAENVPENLLNGKTDGAENANLAQAQPTNEVLDKNAAEVKDFSLNKEVSAQNSEEISAEVQNVQGDGVPQSLVNIANDNSDTLDDAAQTADEVESKQLPQNLPPSMPHSEEQSMSVETVNNLQDTAEVPSALVSTDNHEASEDMPSASEPQFGNPNMVEAADDMMPVEEFEENGMLDDQLIDFSE